MSALVKPNKTPQHNWIRLLLLATVLGSLYWMVQQPMVRSVYAPWDKLAHASASFFLWWALRWSLRWKGSWLAIASVAMGAAVELHQVFLPSFSPSLVDWAADVVGVGLAWVSHALTGTQRRVNTLIGNNDALKTEP